MIHRLALQFAVLSLLVNLAYAAQWTRDDMNPGNLVPSRDPDAGSITPDCDETPCEYNVHYFMTKSETPGPGHIPTILYISGGPGQIVDRTQPDLDSLKHKFNIVYFDIRGAGLSAPQSAVDNKDDKFLRAKYVVKDIEKIRQQVLGNDPWDAIYGHSAGTMFAQMYAEQFGKVTSTNPKVRVKTLILSAPISRHVDNEPFRASTIATNLKNILENNADADCLFTSTRVEKIREKVAEILSDLSLKRPETLLKATNNFCFLDPSRIAKIKKALEEKLALIIGTFGSISFVMENHDKLKKSDKFHEAFPYPDIFFSALRILDRLGSPTKKTADLSLETRSLEVDAALILGYYLDSPARGDVASTNCNPKAEFFKTLNSDALADVAKTIYCNKRFDTAAENYRSNAKRLAKLRSERAANVFGIKDGVHRWPVRLMPAPPQSCNRGRDLIAFATDPTDDDKRTAKNLLKQVGFESGEDICAWDPAKHKHNVPVLILKGKQDAATHGCQAEHFFKEGLLNTNNRQFIEFSEFGHDWISEIKPKREGDLATLLVKFINAPAQFGRSSDVRRAMKNLGANFGTRASFAASGC